jgi:hypothetical protein
MTTSEFRTLVLSFPNTESHPHFDRTAFKVVKRRIFATLHEANGTANLKLSEVDQSVFCTVDRNIMYPVPNKWGLQGWTTLELYLASDELIKDALETAYREVFKIRSQE